MSRLNLCQLQEPKAQKEVMSTWEHRLAMTHVEWLPELACGCCLFNRHGLSTMIVYDAATGSLMCLMVVYDVSCALIQSFVFAQTGGPLVDFGDQHAFHQ